MSRTIYTHEHHNCGDQLVFLHLLRALAKSRVSTPFVHFCNGCHHANLQPFVADLPNILLEPFESPLRQEHQHHSIDVWKNHQDFWVNHADRWDWTQFQLAHHAWVAARMGFESPFTIREHLLFDAPCLDDIPAWAREGHIEHDFLIINSEPCSGQFGPMQQHGSGYLDGLIEALLNKGWRILTTAKSAVVCKHFTGDIPHLRCTRDEGYNLAKIGAVSRICRHHIMISTGPKWLTLNVHNHHAHERRRRIVLLDNGERLTFPHIEQLPNVEAVFQIAKTEEWI